jgi:hypothetical protein
VTAIPIFAAALVLALWRDGQPSVRACALTLTLALALVHTSPPALETEDPNAEAQRTIAEADRLVEEASRSR